MMRRVFVAAFLAAMMGMGACGLRAAEPMAAPSDIVAGPMLGSVTDKSARLWLELSVAKPVSVMCFEVERGVRVSEVTVDVEGPLPFVCDVPVNGLSPNKNYRVEVKLDDKRVNLPGPDVVIRTAPPVGSEAAFMVAMASGLGQVQGRGSAPVFKAVTDLSPRAFLFLGDTALLPAKLQEYPTMHRPAMRLISDAYSKVRREPDLQALFRTTGCYAVWGERDFGIPGSDKEWVFKKEAWSAFQRFWPNPDWGTPENPGCYFSFVMGDAEFFMLDGRMFRDGPGGAGSSGKTMLGEAQLEWLRKGLGESRATFKIIGCGSQLLAEDSPQADTWARYQPEQKDFVKWIFDHDVSGVIFVSGGKVGEITAIKQPLGHPRAYPLFELTSGMLAGTAAKEPGENPNRQGAAVMENGFATLDFGGAREHRFVTLRLRGEDGKIKVPEQTLFATQLKK